MSYHSSRGRTLYQPMGATGYAGDLSPCLAAAVKASAQLVADREQLMRAWKVKAFYRVEDMDKILDQVLPMMVKAKDAVTAAKNQGDFTLKSSEYAQWNEAVLQIFARIRDAQPYIQTINAAKAKGITIIDAPGFQKWVDKALMSVEGAVETIACMAAIKPALLVALDEIFAWVRNVLGVLKAIVDVLLEAAAAVGQAIMMAPETIGSLWTVMKWGTIAFGGLWLYSKLRR